MAAARLPDLVHAVHRRRAAREAGGDRSAREVPITGRPAGPGVQARAASPAASSTSPTRSPSQRPGASTRRSARMLHTGDWKIDPAPLVGATDRRRRTADAGQRGRAGHGLRLHQRLRRRHAGLRGRGARQPDQLIARLSATGRRRPASPPTWRAWRRRRRRRRPPAASCPGRPLDAPHGRRGARGRATCRTSSRSSTSARPSCRRDKRALSLHRQPGRAARALSRIADGPASAGAARARATPSSSRSRSSPATRARSATCRTSSPPGRAALHRARPLRPRLRPSVPRRAGADVPLDPAADRRCRCMARPPPARAASAWREQMGVPQRC